MAENNIHADGQNILSLVIPIFWYMLSICIYMFRVYSRNWPMRVKWALFGNFGGGPFLRKGVLERGFHRRYLNLLVQTVPWENEHLLTFCRHFGTFWATEKARLKWLQNPECLSGEIMTQTKKRKAIETVRGYKSSK